jgi:hypothetical protein
MGSLSFCTEVKIPDDKVQKLVDWFRMVQTHLAGQPPQNTVLAANILDHSEVGRDWQTIGRPLTGLNQCRSLRARVFLQFGLGGRFPGRPWRLHLTNLFLEGVKVLLQLLQLLIGLKCFLSLACQLTLLIDDDAAVAVEGFFQQLDFLVTGTGCRRDFSIVFRKRDFLVGSESRLDCCSTG